MSRKVSCSPLLRRLFHALALAVITFAIAACGGPDDHTGLPSPMGTVCVPFGFGSATATLVGPAGAGGLDGVCTFVLESSNSGVVAISPSVVTVRDNSSATFTLTTIGNSAGRSTVTALAENGSRQSLGVLEVGC